MKYFIIWLVGILLVYFVPIGIWAFIKLDMSIFDFRTWTEFGRACIVVLEIVWCVLFMVMDRERYSIDEL